MLLCRGFLYAGGLWLSFHLWSGGVPWCFCGITPVGAFRKTRFAKIGWTARLDEDDEWWKPREHLELLCMQPKNDYSGSQIVAGRCKKHNSKQQWEIVGEKVRKAEQ